MKTILFYSDCDFFAGSENMIEVLYKSSIVRNIYNVKFMFPKSNEYSSGLEKRQFSKENLRAVTVFGRDFERRLAQSNAAKPLVGKLILGVLYTLLLYALYFLNTIQLYMLIRPIKPSIIHINNGGYPGALTAHAAALAAKLNRVPAVIMVVNNLAVSRAGKPARQFQFVIDLLTRASVDTFVTGSNFASIALQNELELKPGECLAINNAVSSRLAGYRSFNKEKHDEFTFATIGHLVPRKGHAVVLRAVAELKSLGLKNFQLLVEGGGDQLDELQALATNLGIADIVKFIGPIADIHTIYELMDCLVIPSVDHEDFPNVVIESFAFGRPVLGSNLAGIAEQIQHGVNGYLFEIGDFKTLAKYMGQVMTSKSKLRSLGLNATSSYENKYANLVVETKYLDLYQQVLLEK